MLQLKLKGSEGMRYVTEYRLRAGYDAGVDPESTAQLIIDCLKTDPAMSDIGFIPEQLPYELARYNGYWHDHESNIKTLARRFPGCTFTLHGKGEEDDDEWEIEFKGNSTRYRSVSVRWSEPGSGFEGCYCPAYYTLHFDLPKNGKTGEFCERLIQWMRDNDADWAQVFDLDVERPVRTFESRGAAEWYGYAQMRDLAKAFPECAFELRCVPAAKGTEYIYRVQGEETAFKHTEPVWSDWSDVQ